MDDTDLTRAGWRSLAAFQRMIGLHAPDAEVLETDAFVASRVPATHASIINAAVPLERTGSRTTSTRSSVSMTASRSGACGSTRPAPRTRRR